MRGVWIYNSFFLCVVGMVVSIGLRSDALFGLTFASIGAWAMAVNWIQTTHEDEAFEIERWRERFPFIYHSGWVSFRKRPKLTRERFHEDFEQYRWNRLLMLYPIGALFVGLGLWMTVRAVLRAMGNG